MTSGYPENSGQYPGPYPPPGDHPGQDPYPAQDPYSAQGAYPPAGPGYGGSPYQRRGSGMATAAMVLGIIGLVFCWTIVGGIVLGLLAVILGTIAYRRARRGEAEGQGRALAGVITGGLGVLLAGGLIAIGISILNTDSVKNLRSCLDNAGNDQAAVNQCQQQFRDNFGN